MIRLQLPAKEAARILLLFYVTCLKNDGIQMDMVRLRR